MSYRCRIMFVGLVTLFSTLGLVRLQVLSIGRFDLGTCEESLPLEEYGNFDTLSTDGVVVHSYFPRRSHLLVVQIIGASVVCQVNGGRRNTVSTIASVVAYRCSGSFCPSNSIITELFHLDCRTSGNFIPYAISQGDIRTETTATLSTPLEKQCGACRLPTALAPSDPVTHCIPCHEDCIGLRLCLGRSPENCCNYYYEDNCVVSCPDHLTPNSLFVCDCGEFSIDRMQVAYSDSQFIGSVATLTCDSGNDSVSVQNGVVFRDETDLISGQQHCTSNLGWIPSGNSSVNCIPRVFIEYPEVSIVAPIGTRISLACSVTAEYRVVWIVEIPGIGRFETEDSAAISALQDVGFVTEITSAQNRENPLSITGSLRNNQATVQCAAVNVSNNLMKFVFETLNTVAFFGPPPNLVATENGLGSLTISWSAQPGEGLSYTVIISNLNDSSGEPMRVKGIWDNQYTFTQELDDPTSCELYQFQVIPVNRQGVEGSSEMITTGLPSLQSPPLVEQMLRKMAGMIVIQVTIDFITPCPYYPPHNYTVVVTNIEGNVATLTNDYPTTESTIVLDIPNVKKDTQYSLYVVVTNQIGDSPKSAFTGLSIFRSSDGNNQVIVGTVVPVVLLLGVFINIIIYISYRHILKKGYSSIRDDEPSRYQGPQQQVHDQQPINDLIEALERSMQGPIEGLVHKPMKSLDDGSVEKQIEGPVEESIKISFIEEGPVEEPIEITVEESIEGSVEEQTKGPAEEPIEITVEESIEGSVEEQTKGPAEEPIEITVEESIEGPVEEQTEGPAEEPIEITVEESIEGPVEEQTEGPVEELIEIESIEGFVEEPVEEAIEISFEELVEEGPVEEQMKGSVEETLIEEGPFEEPIEKTVEEPIVEEQTEGPVEEAIEISFEELFEEGPVEEPIEKTVEEPIEGPVEEQTEGPVEEAIEISFEEVFEEGPVEEPIEKNVEEPIEGPVEEGPVEETIGISFELSEEGPVEETIGISFELSKEGPVEALIEGPVDKPIEGPVEEQPVEEEKTIGGPVQRPAHELFEGSEISEGTAPGLFQEAGEEPADSQNPVDEPVREIVYDTAKLQGSEEEIAVQKLKSSDSPSLRSPFHITRSQVQESQESSESEDQSPDIEIPRRKSVLGPVQPFRIPSKSSVKDIVKFYKSYKKPSQRAIGELERNIRHGSGHGPESYTETERHYQTVSRGSLKRADQRPSLRSLHEKANSLRPSQEEVRGIYDKSSQGSSLGSTLEEDRSLYKRNSQGSNYEPRYKRTSQGSLDESRKLFQRRSQAGVQGLTRAQNRGSVQGFSRTLSQGSSVGQIKTPNRERTSQRSLQRQSELLFDQESVEELNVDRTQAGKTNRGPPELFQWMSQRSVHDHDGSIVRPERTPRKSPHKESVQEPAERQSIQPQYSEVSIPEKAQKLFNRKSIHDRLIQGQDQTSIRESLIKVERKNSLRNISPDLLSSEASKESV